MVRVHRWAGLSFFLVSKSISILLLSQALGDESHDTSLPFPAARGRVNAEEGKRIRGADFARIVHIDRILTGHVVELAEEPNGLVVIASHRATGLGLTNDGIVEGLTLADLVSEARLRNFLRDDVQDVTLTGSVGHAAVHAVLQVPYVVVVATAVVALIEVSIVDAVRAFDFRAISAQSRASYFVNLSLSYLCSRPSRGTCRLGSR